jgi:thioredoxin:protein disulfide reductase
MAKNITFFILIFVSILFPLTLHAQFGFPGSSSGDKVSTSVFLSVDNVHPGAEFYIAIRLDIDDEWHINAYVPTFDYLIGTRLNLGETDVFELTGMTYPSSKKYRFAFADDELDVYEGRIYIYLKARTSRDLVPGDYTIPGTLTVQACDDQICLAPSDLTIDVPVRVAGLETPAGLINREIFTDEVTESIGALSVPGAGDDETARLAAMFDEGNLFIAFGVIFLIGLALNLTPCVYPMLTVTVSVFGAQTDTNTMRVFFKALIYVLGIATMYSVLGVAAALSGGLFGGILQSTWVMAGIAVLFFALALSLFGLYEIQLPYWLTSRLGGTQTAGILGIYISGLVVGIFAAPCIGPPIIALLALVGQKADPVFGFMSFFILSLGLGFPYLILGTFSGLLSKLPKSGSWMEWVKKVFGVVLIGVGFFYLSLAYKPDLIYILVPLTLLIGGIYLGFIDRSSTGRRLFPWIKRTVGIAAIAGGILFYLGGQKPAIEWESYTGEKLSSALESGKPVVLYFSASWCIPCLELDRLTFTDETVIDEMSRLVLLKVDLTNFDSPESQELRSIYDIAGVPTIVFIDPGGEEVTTIRVVGFVPADDLLERVRVLHTMVVIVGAGDS